MEPRSCLGILTLHSGDQDVAAAQHTGGVSVDRRRTPQGPSSLGCRGRVALVPRKGRLNGGSIDNDRLNIFRPPGCTFLVAIP